MKLTNKLKVFLEELINPLMWFQSEPYDQDLDDRLNKELDSCTYYDWFVPGVNKGLSCYVIIKFCGQEYFILCWRKYFEWFTHRKRPSRVKDLLEKQFGDSLRLLKNRMLLTGDYTNRR